MANIAKTLMAELESLREEMKEINWARGKPVDCSSVEDLQRVGIDLMIENENLRKSCKSLSFEDYCTIRNALGDAYLFFHVASKEHRPGEDEIVEAISKALVLIDEKAPEEE